MLTLNLDNDVAYISKEYNYFEYLNDNLGSFEVIPYYNSFFIKSSNEDIRLNIFCYVPVEYWINKSIENLTNFLKRLRFETRDSSFGDWRLHKDNRKKIALILYYGDYQYNIEYVIHDEEIHLIEIFKWNFETDNRVELYISEEL